MVDRLIRPIRFVISDQEQRWIRAIYPGLNFTGGNPPRSLAGRLEFDYKPPRCPSTTTYTGPFAGRIRDSYNVEVLFDEPRPAYTTLPAVKELDGRIKKSEELHGIANPSDMHITPEGLMCLCAPPEESDLLPNGFVLDQYISELLVPFLYAQSFFEEHGVWPWGTRSHGFLGVLESYLYMSESKKEVDPLKATETFNSLMKASSDNGMKWIRKALAADDPPRGHAPCPCGSAKPFRTCHSDAFRGLWQLWQDVRASERREG